MGFQVPPPPSFGAPSGRATSDVNKKSHAIEPRPHIDKKPEANDDKLESEKFSLPFSPKYNKVRYVIKKSRAVAPRPRIDKKPEANDKLESEKINTFFHYTEQEVVTR